MNVEPSRGASDEAFEALYFSGDRLYGDDFSYQQIQKWFAEEESGYFDIAHTDGEYTYPYEALNRRHAFNALKGKSFGCCVAFGCARGDELAPLAQQVDHFVAIEPAEQWWSDEIAGRPATFLKPAITGDIALPDRSADLITCLGVLHHIPNSGHVLTELGRIAKPGAIIALREPIYSMGDWRRPRKGLTKNERGFPRTWLKAKLVEAGFTIVRERPCIFPPLVRVLEKAGFYHPFKVPGAPMLDSLLSKLFGGRMVYHRKNLRDKLAPTSMFILARKN